jgi:predicted Fe-Mo cluster-binding NifX family protein
MKIAAVTDDGNTISQHFGRAASYLVVTIENGQIVNRELRNKLGHAHFSSQPHSQAHSGQHHGMDAGSHNKHVEMAQAIADCEALLARGMGMGAYESLKVLGIKPILTDITEIDQAVSAYIDGTIVDHVDSLH